MDDQVSSSNTSELDVQLQVVTGHGNVQPVSKIGSISRWVVVFSTNLPPDTLGADYYARVILDAQTGAVLELLSGD